VIKLRTSKAKMTIGTYSIFLIWLTASYQLECPPDLQYRRTMLSEHMPQHPVPICERRNTICYMISSFLLHISTRLSRVPIKVSTYSWCEFTQETQRELSTFLVNPLNADTSWITLSKLYAAASRSYLRETKHNL
jgi:hypothetical protein